MEHPTLGLLKWDGESYWSGSRTIDGNIIEFFVDGTEESVFQDPAEYCSVILDNFATYLDQALNAIASSESISIIEARQRFRPTEVFSVSKEENAALFYLGFADKGDEFALWRVQFDNDVATYVGCDT